jgi:acyl-CoA thioesterase
MAFSDLMNSLSGAEGTYTITITEDWAQGRATFGGLIAAIGNEAMRKLIPIDKPLRSLQTMFVGPAATPATLTAHAKVLRVGKAVSLAQCELRIGDEVVATLVGVYGSPRSSVVAYKPAPIPAPRGVDEINEMRYQADRNPAFVQHFAVRWAEGSKPFSSAPRAPTKAFIRHRDPAAAGESSIVALVDCIPTPAWSMFSAPAPASTLTWLLEFFEHDFNFPATAWWRIDSEVDAAADGYVNQTAVLNDPNGRPVALSRQLFAIFN